MADLKGVSADADIVTNEQGGKQSKVSYGFHLIDTDAILSLAEVLQYGISRYSRDNWRKIPSEEHFNHMLIHYYAWLSGDTSDNHLGHMFCRAMMLYATAKAEEAEKDKPSTIPAIDPSDMGEKDVSEPEEVGEELVKTVGENPYVPEDWKQRVDKLKGKYEGLSNSILKECVCTHFSDCGDGCPLYVKYQTYKCENIWIANHPEEFRKIAIEYLEGLEGK